MKEKINKKELLENIKKSWKYAKHQKRTLILFAITSLLLGIISAVIPILAASVLLKLTSGLYEELLFFATIIFAVGMFRNGLNFLSHRYSQIFFRESLLVIQKEVASETLNLETEEIDKNSSGIFIDRINKDTRDIADVYYQISAAFTNIVTNLGVMVAVLIISKEFFGFFVIALIILFLIRRKQFQLFFKFDKTHREINEKNTGLITELVRGIRDIKLLNADTNFVSKITHKFKESNQVAYEKVGILRIFNFIAGSIQDIFNLLFIVFGIYLIQQNMLVISSFVILYMYQSKVYNLLNFSAALLESLKKFNLSANRVFEVIENNKFKKEYFGSKFLPKINGSFEFKNVSFSYNEDTKILKDINFKINANETVAFVGKSGSGKTTIFSLLTKLYHVDSGEILIDDINIDLLDKETLRSNISIITQTPYIFNFTIRENLSIVKEDITDSEMIKACKLACLHDYIISLPAGYDTMIGEGGMTLSGGQRQRLAIARALIKKSEIILFDEATSALDNQTQSSIQQAINNMKSEYTILIIAHRLSTVVDSDRIIVVDDGKIIAEGNHKHLLKTNLIYKDLYETELEK